MRRSLFLAALVLAGCAVPVDSPAPPSPEAPLGAFSLTSAAFQDGGTMPRTYTCDGESLSPPLALAGAPANATTVAILVIDPDVPTPLAPQREIVHWLIWNIPLVNGSATLDEGKVPEGAVQGDRGNGQSKYAGPCPPQGSPAHRYIFTAHAVDGALRLDAGSTREQLEAALKDHSLATAKLTGTYARALVT